MGKYLAIKLIHGYRYLLSPWIGNQCRFYPTCSHYAEEAIETHGFLKGSALGVKRLLKCHPWHPGGIDLVPIKEAQEKEEVLTKAHKQENIEQSHTPQPRQ